MKKLFDFERALLVWFSVGTRGNNFDDCSSFRNLLVTLGRIYEEIL